MHDDHTPAKAAGPDLLAEMKYEHRDIALNKLMGFIAVFFVGFIVAMIVTVGIYNFFIPNFARAGQIPAPSAYRRLPPHPQIQVDPRRDMEFFRLAEDKQVSGEQGAVPNTTPAMTVTAAMDKLAGEEGIAGIKGTAEAKRGDYWPGSRAFDGKAPVKTHDADDMANPSHSGAPSSVEGEHTDTSPGTSH